MPIITEIKIFELRDQPLFDPEAPGADPEDFETWPCVGRRSFYRASILIGTKRLALESPEGLTTESYNKLVEAIAAILMDPSKRPKLEETSLCPSS